MASSMAFTAKERLALLLDDADYPEDVPQKASCALQPSTKVNRSGGHVGWDSSPIGSSSHPHIYGCETSLGDPNDYEDSIYNGRRDTSPTPEWLQNNTTPSGNPLLTPPAPSTIPKLTGKDKEFARPTIGSLAAVGDAFCPIVAVSKYPYKFVRNKELGERIAHGFFNEGKFWKYHWDIYYAWSPQGNFKPLMLVPSQQVELLIASVDRGLKGACPSLSAISALFGLTLTFDDPHPAQRPRYLGFSRSQEQFKSLESSCPGPNYRPPGEADCQKPPDSAAQTQYAKQLDLGADLCTNRKGKKAERQQQHFQRQQDMHGDLKQAKRFLGLHKGEADLASPVTRTESWVSDGETLEPVSVSSPPPYPFGSSVVFISIDVESWERNKNMITEIGISTLDVLDITGQPPGENGMNWRSAIHSRHLRIKEHAHLNNFEFVHGCAGNFLFGSSEFVSLQDAPAVIATFFRHTFSLPDASDASEVEMDEEKRALVLVGHDFSADIRYLEKIGYAVQNLSSLHKTHPVIDTQQIYRAHSGHRDPDKLSRLLEDMDVAPFGLHNAGNDARYTMEAMIGIAVQSAVERYARETKNLEAEASG